MKCKNISISIFDPCEGIKVDSHVKRFHLSCQILWKIFYRTYEFYKNFDILQMNFVSYKTLNYYTTEKLIINIMLVCYEI